MQQMYYYKFYKQLIMIISNIYNWILFIAVLFKWIVIEMEVDSKRFHLIGNRAIVAVNDTPKCHFHSPKLTWNSLDSIGQQQKTRNRNGNETVSVALYVEGGWSRGHEIAKR